MDLLKDLLARLSDRFFNTVPTGFRRQVGKRLRPFLKVVSHNPHPVHPQELSHGRYSYPSVGHAEAIDEAIENTTALLLAQQNSEEGYWVYELEADTTLTSEYVMLRRFLGLVDPERERQAVQYLRQMQLDDGGWPIYAGGPADISASVKAYFALKLAGVSSEEPFMICAREIVLGKGGVVSANVFTKITLALFGQYSWEGIPSMPPEIMLVPKRFYFNVYAVSYWSRAVLIPLLIVFGQRPLCSIQPEQGIEELFLTPRDRIRFQEVPPFKKDPCWLSWRNVFIWIDRMLKVYDRYPLQSLRKKALKKAEMWMIEHMRGDGGLGAIYPAMANSIFALHALGYATDHPLVVKALKEIEELEVRTPRSENRGLPATLHLQPCHSPIWDTALMINVLVENGFPIENPRLGQAANWLRSKQSQCEGDWVVSAPGVRPGGWYFQFENKLYPDVDDTATVVMALAKLSQELPADRDDHIRHGFEWALGMQGSDGGWGAYDKNNNRLIFNKIPFADHQALLDPSTADLAGRCLEMLGTLGYDRSHPSAGPAIDFLRREQELNGSWYGRWGVNYIYGTWSVLAGLRAIGEDMSALWIQKAVLWLESSQNVDGGWGESCLSYADQDWAGQGESTPSQTAWALLALLSAGVSDSLNVVRGINFLLRHQRQDGSWNEPLHTGTGFPRVFYLRYHGYAQYFPLWALSMYRNVRIGGEAKADELRQIAQARRITAPKVS